MPLSGDWFNELGSKMTLQMNGQDVTGYYYTAVGDAEGTYSLTGRTNASNTVLGFSIAWQNDYGDSESATAWSGEYHAQDDVIVTTWLLTAQTDEADDWKSTTVGKDVFQRQSPSKDVVSRAKRLRAPSHPTRLLRRRKSKA
jgi:hypothetical protein